MTNDTKPVTKRPGSKLIPIGLVLLAIGFMLLIFNLANPVSNYVAGVGMVETRGPSAGAIIGIVAGLLLAGIGFARRILAAVEKR